MTTQTKPQLSIDECDRLLCSPGTIFELGEPVTLFGQPTKVWKHTPPTFRAFFLATFPKWAKLGRILVSEPMVTGAAHERVHVSYAEVWRRSIHLGAYLRELNVKAGTRVALGGGNSSHWMVAFIACHLIGAVPVLLNSTLHIDAQLHCLTLTKPAIVLCDGKFADILAPHTARLAAKHVGQIFCWTSLAHHPERTRVAIKDLTGVKASQPEIVAVERGEGMQGVHPESDSMIMFTSGTTNLPKGVLITQRGALTHVISSSIPAARAILRMGGSLEDALSAHNPPLDSQGAMLLAVPLFHVTGSMGWMMRGFHLGAKMVFMTRWNVKAAAELIVEEKINAIGGVPAIATAVIQSGLLPEDHVMDGVTYGGAPPPKRLADDIFKRWPNCLATHAYGMTETAGLHTALAGPDYLENPEAVGPPMPVDEIRIVHPKTLQPLPVHELGEVQCRGANIMKCYVDNEKATKAAITEDGWLNTGDLARMDEQGYLYIRDRAKDVIIRGGENIASAEVENAIHQDDRIAEVAAVPVPCELMGERVGLGVSLAPGAKATPEEIMAAAQPRLRHPAQPVVVVIFDALPRNANAKIVKSDVKKVVVAEWERITRAVRAKL